MYPKPTLILPLDSRGVQSFPETAMSEDMQQTELCPLVSSGKTTEADVPFI